VADFRENRRSIPFPWTALFSFYQNLEDALCLLDDNLNQHSLSATAVKFTVKDLFPGAEMQFSLYDGNHHLAAHYLPFHVRILVLQNQSPRGAEQSFDGYQIYF
jgi:hypothetical protein